jgi:hypothetical protein
MLVIKCFSMLARPIVTAKIIQHLSRMSSGVLSVVIIKIRCTEMLYCVVWQMVSSFWDSTFTLKMKVAGFFETLAFSYRKARRHVSEDHTLFLVICLQKNVVYLLKNLRIRNCGALPTRLWTP